MKILVPIKRVIDFNVNIRVRDDGTGVETDNVKMSMNPFDEIAVEEALKLREAGVAEEVVVVSVGVEKAQDVLRTSLAMGADRAILVKTSDDVEPLNVAKILKAIVGQEHPQLVLLGKQAIDNDANQVAQMLSALLNWGQATFASDIDISGTKVRVSREVDAGLQTIEVNLPAVISVDLRLNTPRYATLPNVMKAKRKPLDIKTPEDFAVDVSLRHTILETLPPAARKGGVVVANVDELVDKLKNQAGVI
ncbi:MAG: electron transfer flavoprotein subunit beta/FixA family protein [Devosiaceae bacterium]|nr:electron transfer flavoprotein subunit beta/FixA family protein [Devosiaceae bacterium]